MQFLLSPSFISFVFVLFKNIGGVLPSLKWIDNLLPITIRIKEKTVNFSPFSVTHLFSRTYNVSPFTETPAMQRTQALELMPFHTRLSTARSSQYKYFLCTTNLVTFFICFDFRFCTTRADCPKGRYCQGAFCGLFQFNSISFYLSMRFIYRIPH